VGGGIVTRARVTPTDPAAALRHGVARRVRDTAIVMAPPGFNARSVNHRF
jgi:hypothetical protein